MNKVYCIKGFNINGDRRYIQLGDYSRIPEITTRLGYRAYNRIVFTTFEEAANFLVKFIQSDRRRNLYPIDWKVCEYKPYNGMEFTQERSTWSNDYKRRSIKTIKYVRKPYPIDTIYGPAYKLSTEEVA